MASRKNISEVPENGAAALTKGEAAAERILDAAFRSIAAHGCGAVTLRGIAVEAGVVLSQLNYYYGNKNRLFAAVLKRMRLDYMDGLDAQLGGQVSVADQIVALIDYNERVLKETPDVYRNFLEFFNFAMSSPEFQADVAEFTSGIAAVIESHIAVCKPDDADKDRFSAPVVTRYIMSASFGIALQHFLSPESVDVAKGFDVIKATVIHLIGRQA